MARAWSKAELLELWATTDGASTPESLEVLELLLDHELDLEPMDDEARALLSELVNRMGLQKKRFDPRGALSLFDVALEASTASTRQAILYNRGIAQLLASVRDLPRGDLRARGSVRETVSLWRGAATDLEDAVALASDDDAAWAQLALAHLLLAAAARSLSVNERVASSERALAAYDRCLAVLPAARASERATVVENRGRALAVGKWLRALPWWTKVLRAGELSLDAVR